MSYIADIFKLVNAYVKVITLVRNIHCLNEMAPGTASFITEGLYNNGNHNVAIKVELLPKFKRIMHYLDNLVEYSELEGHTNNSINEVRKKITLRVTKGLTASLRKQIQIIYIFLYE